MKWMIDRALSLCSDHSKCFMLHFSHIHTLMAESAMHGANHPSGANSGLSVFPSDTSTWGMEEATKNQTCGTAKLRRTQGFMCCGAFVQFPGVNATQAAAPTNN